MSKVLRSAKGVPACSVLLAALVLTSCGAGDGTASPAPDAPAIPAIEAAEPAIDAAAPESAAPVSAAPVKEARQPAAAAEPAYVGTWGNDLAQCAIPQEYEQPPMIMRADGFDQHEAHCDFDTVTETGPAQWAVTGQCSVEGDEQPLDYNMAIVDGNLQHWSGDARKEAWTLVRCPE